MKRILIVGCSGAGKSTLALTLAQRLELPVVHLDRLWWRPGWENCTQEEFDAQLGRELERDCWIIDGNYDRTLPIRLARCDTVIWLDYPRRTCLLGAAGRVLSQMGRSRPDMAEGCPERIDWEFFPFIWGFKREQGVRLASLLNSCGKTVYRFRRRRECAQFLEGVTPCSSAS
ncbi:MAG: hypothetical protein EOM52_11125 [Clostridia bacterium]|nr:hypothetical protein [Clostridia bacterium]